VSVEEEKSARSLELLTEEERMRLPELEERQEGLLELRVTVARRLPLPGESWVQVLD